jgi:hypothetical protein
MAAALRFAAERLCGGALECPPQVFLTAAKELARSTKEDLALSTVQQLHQVIASTKPP